MKEKGKHKGQLARKRVYEYLTKDYGRGYSTMEIAKCLRIEVQTARNAMASLITRGVVYKVAHPFGRLKNWKFFAKDPKSETLNMGNSYNNINSLSIFGKSKACITKEDRKHIRSHKLIEQ